MADEFQSGDDRTEEATPERRDDFRERGQIAYSREVTSVIVLFGCAMFVAAFMPTMMNRIFRLFTANFHKIADFRVDSTNAMEYATSTWKDFLFMIIPVFLVTMVLATAGTFLQTRFNWSWKKLSPDFSRMNLFAGMKRMVSIDSVVEIIKGIMKLAVIGSVAYWILKNEWSAVPALMMTPIGDTWRHWGSITKSLFLSVSGAMVAIGGLDYFYTLFGLEKKMRMTKQEVKEEYKKRELDPQVKGRMRRMQREILNRKTVEKTKDATVLITNPTHYSIAVKYEIGMTAPKVLAKGLDFVALKMREVAKENNIPIVENRPLARTLYKLVEEDQEIPEDLFTAVAEVIKYVFKLKGIKVPRKGQDGIRPEPRVP